MSRWVFFLIQFFPLSVFAAYAFWYGVPGNERWLQAFQLGAALGLLQLISILMQKRAVNRLILSGNLYLIFGGIASFFEQWWYLQWYGALRESAIILFMIVVGLITTFTSSAGYVAVEDSPRSFSVCLLIATVLMMPVALFFEGDRIYSIVLPIIFLAILLRYLVFLASPKDMSNSTV